MEGGSTRDQELRSHTTLPSADLERIKKFYADKLDLHPATESPGGLGYEDSEDNMIGVVELPPGAQPGT